MLVKFPFRDSLMKDMRLIQHSQTSTFSVKSLIELAKRFPQLDLKNSASLERLREEFLDFKLTPTSELPEVKEYKGADGKMKAKAGLFWLEVRKMCTMEGEPRFDHLQKLVCGLMSIPISSLMSTMQKVQKEIYHPQCQHRPLSTQLPLPQPQPKALPLLPL
jgi:hypothetical protein